MSVNLLSKRESFREIFRKSLPLRLGTIATILTIVVGVVSGYRAGPAPPQKFYLTMNTPLMHQLFKSIFQFQFTWELGEYLANNFGLWVVIFLLGSILPVFTFDILSYNMRMIVQVSLYLKEKALLVFLLHGVYEIGALIMVSLASYTIFFTIIREIWYLARGEEPPEESFSFIVQLLVISFAALGMAALIEAFVTPIFWGV